MEKIGTYLKDLKNNTKALIINKINLNYYKILVFGQLNSNNPHIEIKVWTDEKLYDYWENVKNISPEEINKINKLLILIITNYEKANIINRKYQTITEDDETNIKNILNKNNNEGVQIKMENPNLQLNMLSTNASNKLDEVKENLNNINILINQLLEENENLKEEIKNNKNELNIGNIQALKIFKNIKDFITQIKNLYNVTTWGIYPGTYSDRATVIKKYSYYNELKDEFNEKNLTNKPIGEEQIISFFDTMYLMYKILSQITDEKIKQDMKIIMEYVIPEPSKPRIDYMLVYRNSILLLEFSKASSIETISNEQGHKLQQVNGYATLLKSNINNAKIDINVAVGMYLDESTDANIELTNRTIDDIKKKINKFFKKDELKNAFELLSELE